MMDEYDIFFAYCLGEEGKKEGKKEGRKEGRKERNEEIPPLFLS